MIKAIERIQSSQDKLLTGHKSLESFEFRTKVDLLESKILALESYSSNPSTVSSIQISDILQEFA
jgi:hypothetical protein